MTDRTVEHGTFSVERIYPAAADAVFAAWATQAAKDVWFGTGDDFLEVTDRYALDFREGGRERLVGRFANGRTFSYDAIYHDIVVGRRIVTSYDVAIDGRRTSVSLMTVEFTETTGGTRVVLTEQGAFLDGLDSNAQREEGALDSLDKLGRYLEAGVTSAS